MKKKIKKYIALVLSLVMVFSCTCFADEEEIPKTIEYTFSSDGTLTFTGTGILDNSYTETITNIESIMSVKIGVGITEIAANAFENCTNLANAEIPYTVKIIGEDAFKGVAEDFIACVHEGSQAVNYFDNEHKKIINHTLTSADFLWSSNFRKCAVNFNCSVCDITNILRLCTVTSKVAVPPTCSKKGTTEYTATYKNVSEKKTVQDIAMLDHQWNTKYTIDEEANCTNGGVKSYHCKVCDAKKPGSEVVIPRKKGAHVFETITKKPENHQNGYTYDKCEICGYKTPIEYITYKSTNYVKNFKVEPGTGSFTAKWKKQSSTKFDGYIITYSKYKSMKNSKIVKVSRNASSKKISKLSKNKKYYVEICSYEIYKNNYYFSVATKAAITTK